MKQVKAFLAVFGLVAGLVGIVYLIAHLSVWEVVGVFLCYALIGAVAAKLCKH